MKNTGFRYTDEMIDFIRENAPGNACVVLAKMFNERFGTDKNAYNMKWIKNEHHIHSGKVKPVEQRRRIIFTEDIKSYINANISGTRKEIMAQMVNDKFGTSITPKQIEGYKKNNNVHSGKKGLFSERNLPKDKNGKKDRSYIGTHPNSKKYHFKKGSVPHNNLPIGTEHTRNGYWWVKVANPDVWKMKHHLIWEQAHGELEDGAVLIFLDNDKNNCTLENIAKVNGSEATYMLALKRRTENRDVTDAYINLSRLEMKVRKMKNEHE